VSNSQGQAALEVDAIVDANMEEVSENLREFRSAIQALQDAQRQLVGDSQQLRQEMSRAHEERCALLEHRIDAGKQEGQQVREEVAQLQAEMAQSTQRLAGQCAQNAKQTESLAATMVQQLQASEAARAAACTALEQQLEQLDAQQQEQFEAVQAALDAAAQQSSAHEQVMEQQLAAVEARVAEETTVLQNYIAVTDERLGDFEAEIGRCQESAEDFVQQLGADREARDMELNTLGTQLARLQDTLTTQCALLQDSVETLTDDLAAHAQFTSQAIADAREEAAEMQQQVTQDIVTREAAALEKVDVKVKDLHNFCVQVLSSFDHYCLCGVLSICFAFSF
jgi:chromosome segregation ATPase